MLHIDLFPSLHEQKYVLSTNQKLSRSIFIHTNYHHLNYNTCYVTVLVYFVAWEWRWHTKFVHILQCPIKILMFFSACFCVLTILKSLPAKYKRWQIMK